MLVQGNLWVVFIEGPQGSYLRQLWDLNKPLEVLKVAGAIEQILQPAEYKSKGNQIHEHILSGPLDSPGGKSASLKGEAKLYWSYLCF